MSTAPINAEELSAFYDPVHHELTLSAKGSVQPVTENIHFVRLPFVGGLLFQLIGTTYAIMGEKRPYEVSQKVPVSIIPFPKDVIIKTADRPAGQPVRINWGGLKGPVNDLAPSSVEGTAPSRQLVAPNQHAITALLGAQFIIKQDAHVPKYGTVSIDFDKEKLELANAAINDTLIDWTFVGKEPGQTQVIVTVGGGIADFVMSIPYNVNILRFTPESAPK